MKYKLSPIERSVGFFLMFCFVGMFFVSAGILARNLFWQHKVTYNLKLQTAGQLQEGSKVQLKGMNIGKVTKVTLNDQAEIIAKFEVGSDYKKFFTENSEIHIINPMVIGEKVVDLKYLPGINLVPDGSFLPVKEGEDIINKLTAIEWNNISPILASLNSTLKKTDKIANRVDSQLPQIFASTDKLTKEALLALHGSNKLIVDLQEAAPLLKTAAKELPEASIKSVRAINEAIIVLKAMQKSFFLRGGVEDVKKEIALEAEEKEKNRVPANAK
jgi:phospholipid/cholesterol/gamma-HCH transport system substrate-binding protein